MENPPPQQQEEQSTGFLFKTGMGALLGFGAGLIALIFVANPALVLLTVTVAGGLFGATSALFGKDNDVPEQQTHDTQQDMQQQQAPAQGMAPELAPTQQMGAVVSPQLTKEDQAFAQVADAFQVLYNPNEQHLPPLPVAEQIRMDTPVPPTEQEQSNLALLAAYSRGEVPDDQALAAYRNIRQEVSRPLLEEGLKAGVKLGMQRAGVTGFSADMSAETLAKPMAQRIGQVMGTGALESYLARDPVLQVAQGAVNHIFPSRAQKIDGRAVELDIAKTIGHFSSLTQQRAPAPVAAR